MLKKLIYSLLAIEDWRRIGISHKNSYYRIKKLLLGKSSANKETEESKEHDTFKSKSEEIVDPRNILKRKLYQGSAATLGLVVIGLISLANSHNIFNLILSAVIILTGCLWFYICLAQYLLLNESEYDQT